MTLAALISILILLISFSIKTTTLTHAHCLPHQRDSLIKLKQGFHTTEQLHSWNTSTDCCIWDGITCDEQTGLVTELNLIDRSISGKLNPALFNLSSLRYLDLSYNQFDDIPLPQTGFEQLSNLTHLDLSYSNFVGQVPIGISALTNLISLDLSNELTMYLYDTSLKSLLGNLSKLQVLYLDGVNISLNGNEWGKSVFQVSSNLQELSMAGGGLSGNFPDEIFLLTNLTVLDLSNNPMYLYDTGLKSLLGNLSNLQVLHLDGVNISLNGNERGKSVFQVSSNLQELSMSDCGLSGNFPEEIFHLTNLTTLDLSDNSMLSGQLPEFTKQNFLQYLSLGYTNFTGPLPDSIRNLQYIQKLFLYRSNFYGEIPPSIANLTRLENLDLSLNRLTGTIPMSLFSHPSLQSLDLSYNQLSGYLPEFSNGSSILESINLDSNNLQGELPISIFKFPQLNLLSLQSNNFNGTLNLDVIQHSKNLDTLYLSNNKLSIIEGRKNNESFYASFPQLEILLLPSCNLTKFPSFLSYQTNILILDLSNNSLMGEIPLSICNATLSTELDLSYNNLIGIVPPCLLEDTELEILNLKSNKLSGPLPQNISQGCRLETINLNGNLINGSLPKRLLYCNALVVLDVGNNRIVDIFPYWLGNLEYLKVVVVRSNMFYGNISDLIIKTKGNDSFFPMVTILDISSNHFSGTLPIYIFVNLKAMMDASYTTYGYDYNLNVTYLLRDVASVTYKGLSLDLMYFHSKLCYIDLSNNEFWGRIPEEIGQLKSLDALYLSHNALSGPIPQNIANLQELQLLDLSFNQLSGHIPQELTSLTFLSALNLSYNNLVGEIPKARQFSTFLNASYLGNPGLCGSPLSMQCAAAPSNDGFDKALPSKSSMDIIGLSVSIGLGLGVGFAFVIWATISWENGRKWFNFIIDRFYIRHFP